MDRNYEQEYKKAFEAAKGLHDAGNALTKKQMEIVFPQLAESEDERIRKEIISALKFANDGGVYDKHIAYLEKQKEQKPILEVFGFKVGDAVRLKDGDGRKHIIKSFEEVEGLHGPNFYHVEFEDNSARSGIYPGEEYQNGFYTQMEKFEKEPKSIQTDAEKEYVRTLKSLVADFVRANNYIERGYYQQIYDWLDGRHVEQKEKKPDTRDSDDLQLLGFIYDLLNEIEWNDNWAMSKEECLRRLNNYRPQKPAEWSEEDENMAYFVNQFLEYHELSDPTAKSCKKWFNNRFKSLRPQGSKDSLQTHWKPSEEQMEALAYAIQVLSPRAAKASEELESLREQLKKL